MPGAGKNRPASLVPSTKESTPDLKLRLDDVGRGFLYQPTLASSFRVPEPATGRRSTDRLTQRAARQIKGAALKAAAIGSPLRTFMTFTMRPEAREAVASGDTVIGHEMSRVLNAIAEGERRRGRRSTVYIWVAENPGDDNPHVHLLTNLRVPREEFDALAARLESLWGHGWVKVEKIRKPKSAGQYILKAVGYSLKGGEGSQGKVAGNRYGIARSILPKYETHAVYDCADAAQGLRDLQQSMEADVERVEGLVLTRYGLSFPAGSNVEQVLEVVGRLGEAVHMSD